MPQDRPRTSQAERSAGTKEALLDATIECLSDLGYTGATTTEIVRRAGVSRGAQVHHYPTKADLVVAALRHLFDQRADEFAERLGALPPAERSLSDAIDLLWQMLQGPLFRAAVTLTVAALSDPQLRPAVAGVLADFDRARSERFAELFPETAAQPFGSTALLFAFVALEGASLYREVGLAGKAEEIVGALRVLSSTVAPGLSVFPGARPAEKSSTDGA